MDVNDQDEAKKMVQNSQNMKIWKCCEVLLKAVFGVGNAHNWRAHAQMLKPLETLGVGTTHKWRVHA
jgi:hypothetical protein